MFQYAWVREITALTLVPFSYGVGYLMLALSLSNLHFKSRPLDRDESSNEILAICHLMEKELFLPVLTYTHWWEVKKTSTAEVKEEGEGKGRVRSAPWLSRRILNGAIFEFGYQDHNRFCCLPILKIFDTCILMELIMEPCSASRWERFSL